MLPLKSRTEKVEKNPAGWFAPFAGSILVVSERFEKSKEVFAGNTPNGQECGDVSVKRVMFYLIRQTSKFRGDGLRP